MSGSRWVALALVTSVFWLNASMAEDSPPPAEPTGIGAKIEDFTLPALGEKEFSLSDTAKQKVVVVAFLGVDCPLVRLYAGRLAELHKEYSKRGVAFVGIDSNSQDAHDEIATFAKTHGLKFPVLIDKEGAVADLFQAKRNPEVFVLDRERVVRYRGRIDDQYGIASGASYHKKEATRRDLAEAINELMAGRDVSQSYIEAPGCVIGRKRAAKPDSSVTFNKHIAPILQEHCEQCHRPGDIAPFPLQTYDDVVGWGDTIEEVVREQRMPPWHADPAHGEFSNDVRLTDEEKQLIKTWVENGSPEGDLADLPPPKKFVEGWRIGKPDKIFAMDSKPFKVPADGVLDYKYYSVSTGFKKDMWVRAAECRPGNRAVVHHIIVFVKAPGEDVKSIVMRSSFLTATAPGAQPMVLGGGLAKKIPAGSELLFQMHYTTNGTPQSDKSEIGLKFIDEKDVTAEVKTDIAGTFLFLIPPHAADHQVNASTTFNTDAMLLSMYPHMHVRGKAFRYTVRYPDGNSEILLDVPRYDFNWQNTYELKEPKFLPKGSVLDCVATYDNSAANLNNPDPSKQVHFGDQTWDEMMLGFFDAVAIDKAGFEKVAARIKESPPQAALAAEVAAEAESSPAEKVARKGARADNESDDGANSAAEVASDDSDEKKPRKVRPVSMRSSEERAESYLKLARSLATRDKKKARDWAQKAIQMAPNSDFAKKAKLLIGELAPPR